MSGRSILLSAFEEVCQFLIKLRVNRIPGTRALYYFLNELIWRWPMENVIKVEGSRMYVDSQAPGAMKSAFRGYIRWRGKEKLTTGIFKKVVKEGQTVIDIGANIGYFTLLAARLVGEKGKVYAFEPEPRNYEVLLKNITLNGYDNVMPAPKAVSNIAGTVKLYLSSKDIGAHTLRESHSHYQFDRSRFGQFIEVESVTLDDFLAEKGHRVDVIKMDAEGAEMLILLGMERTIRENNNLKMFIEFYPSAIKEMGCSPEEFAHRLFNHGFSITAIDELRTPKNQYLPVNNVEELMNLCQDREKIVNLFLERQ